MIKLGRKVIVTRTEWKTVNTTFHYSNKLGVKQTESGIRGMNGVEPAAKGEVGR